MKKTPVVILSVIAILLAATSIFLSLRNGAAIEDPIKDNQTVSNKEDAEIRSLITEFGTRLKNVSLLQSPESVKKDLADNYAPYISPELLTDWQAYPEKAFGRRTSSPWPEKIIIASLKKDGAEAYTVDANIIEVANSASSTEPVSVSPVTIAVVKINGSWKISNVERGIVSQLPKRVTVTGTWECLPHRNPGEFQTLECAFGIRKDDGKHLAVNTMLMSSYPVDYPTGTKVVIDGTLTPIEQLNTDMWDKYDIEGIISAISIRGETSKRSDL